MLYLKSQNKLGLHQVIPPLEVVEPKTYVSLIQTTQPWPEFPLLLQSSFVIRIQLTLGLCAFKWNNVSWIKNVLIHKNKQLETWIKSLIRLRRIIMELSWGEISNMLISNLRIELIRFSRMMMSLMVVILNKLLYVQIFHLIKL